MSIVESTRYKLRKAPGLTLMPPNLCGWEAFPMARALIHTKTTWALSSTAPQVPGVSSGSPLFPWCFRHHEEVRDKIRFYALQENSKDTQIIKIRSSSPHMPYTIKLFKQDFVNLKRHSNQTIKIIFVAQRPYTLKLFKQDFLHLKRVIRIFKFLK